MTAKNLHSSYRWPRSYVRRSGMCSSSIGACWCRSPQAATHSCIFSILWSHYRSRLSFLVIASRSRPWDCCGTYATGVGVRGHQGKNRLTSPVDGTVSEIAVAKDTQVAEGAKVLV